MAYMSQEHKKRIAAELKKVVPAGWKYTLRVQHHSTLAMIVTAAPFDFSGKVDWYENIVRAEYRVNHHNFEREITCDVFREEVRKIIACLNLDNYDHSDSQSDCFNVGHYIALSFGAYGRPYVNTSATVEE